MASRRFYCSFYILVFSVLEIADASYFVEYQTPADCVKLSAGAATSFFFNSVQLKCVECEQPSSAQTVSPDGAFDFILLFIVIVSLKLFANHTEKAMQKIGIHFN